MRKNTIVKSILTCGILFAILTSSLICILLTPISPSVPTIHIQTIEGPIDYLC